MSTVLKLLVSGIVKYLEAHPEEVEKVAEFLIKEILKAVEPKAA